MAVRNKRVVPLAPIKLCRLQCGSEFWAWSFLSKEEEKPHCFLKSLFSYKGGEEINKRERKLRGGGISSSLIWSWMFKFHPKAIWNGWETEPWNWRLCNGDERKGSVGVAFCHLRSKNPLSPSPSLVWLAEQNLERSVKSPFGSTLPGWKWVLEDFPPRDRMKLFIKIAVGNVPDWSDFMGRGGGVKKKAWLYRMPHLCCSWGKRIVKLLRLALIFASEKCYSSPRLQTGTHR